MGCQEEKMVYIENVLGKFACKKQSWNNWSRMGWGIVIQNNNNNWYNLSVMLSILHVVLI